jgi:hypothetical protein
MALARRAPPLLLFGTTFALIATGAGSLLRDTAFGSMSPPVLATGESEPLVSIPRPLTAEEEAFAHAAVAAPSRGGQSVGRAADTSAGIIMFAADDHDANRLAAKLTPLRQVFRDTRETVAAMSAPPSMQPVRDRYVGMLSLYEQSATEMLEVARDGNEGHLIDAQHKSERAAEELAETGEIISPGEHKPN